jgi:hypothetical protein
MVCAQWNPDGEDEHDTEGKKDSTFHGAS